MQVIEANDKCIEAMVVLAKRTYEQECMRLSELAQDDYTDVLRDNITEAVKNYSGAVCLDKGKLLGYLVYNKISKENGEDVYSFPVWGYAAVGEKKDQILSRLFEFMAERMVGPNPAQFRVQLYAHDTNAIWLFSCLQFGVELTECIRNTMDPVHENCTHNVVELTTEQIQENWDQIWGKLLCNIGPHFTGSPIFHSGVTYNEDYYKTILNTPGTRLFVAMNEAGQMIGVMTAEKDMRQFFINDGDYKVGNLYVLDEYRGQEVAQDLLQSVNDTMLLEGTWKLIVEHFTANPQARGFWDRYFKSYLFTMTRTIKSVY